MGEMFLERKLVTSDMSLRLFGDAAVVEFVFAVDDDRYVTLRMTRRRNEENAPVPRDGLGARERTDRRTVHVDEFGLKPVRP